MIELMASIRAAEQRDRSSVRPSSSNHPSPKDRVACGMLERVVPHRRHRTRDSGAFQSIREAAKAAAGEVDDEKVAVAISRGRRLHVNFESARMIASAEPRHIVRFARV